MLAAYLVNDAKPVGAWLARDRRASVYLTGANPKNALPRRLHRPRQPGRNARGGGGGRRGAARDGSYEGFRALSSDKLASERKRIHAMFEGSRPHYMIDTITDLPEVIADINKRLANGEMPQTD